jgi:hypothetical protein
LRAYRQLPTHAARTAVDFGSFHSSPSGFRKSGASREAPAVADRRDTGGSVLRCAEPSSLWSWAEGKESPPLSHACSCLAPRNEPARALRLTLSRPPTTIVSSCNKVLTLEGLTQAVPTMSTRSLGALPRDHYGELERHAMASANLNVRLARVLSPCRPHRPPRRNGRAIDGHLRLAP